MKGIRLKKRVNQFLEQVSNTATYIRLALSGNEVERVTNFRSCRHPVLLLCGFGATRRVFHHLEERLRKDHFCVFSLNLGGLMDTFNTHCIEELAHHVKKKVERLCRRYHLNKISIIGHSKGGLIGHYYIKRLEGHKRVRALITLGTPHQGNPLALIGLVSPLGLISRSIWQMMPLSSFLKRLHRGPFPPPVRLVSIYSKQDRICYYRSAILEVPFGARNIKNIELSGIGHADYLMSRRAYQVIRRELKAGESIR